MNGLVAFTRQDLAWPAIPQVLRQAEPRLMATAAFLVLLMVPTFILAQVDPRLIGGVGAWVKPLKFEASLALQLATIALAWPLLPAKVQTDWRGRAIQMLLIVPALLEMAYIFGRAAQGEGSHFSVATPFTSAMYGLMAAGAVSLVATTAIVGALILRHGANSIIALATGLGFVIGGVLGLFTGFAIGGNGGAGIGGPSPVVGGLPIVGWSTAYGDLRVAHFVGLHAMQIVPLVGLAALALKLPQRAAHQLVLAVSALIVLATGAVWLQARAGLPLIAL